MTVLNAFVAADVATPGNAAASISRFEIRSLFLSTRARLAVAQALFTSHRVTLPTKISFDTVSIFPVE